MKIGIGLPTTLPNVDRELLLAWARKVDQGPFSSLGVIDRLVYPNYEALMALAAAAAVTNRVRLMTAVLLAPLRNPGVLAKQAATIDTLSGGRLTLGMGVGTREDDFEVAPAPFKDRGARFEAQIATMKRIWAGETVAGGEGVVGPPPVQPGGPELLIGAFSPAAIDRVGLCDGYIGGGTDSYGEACFRMAQESWQAHGRSGEPRLVATGSFALGPGALELGMANVGSYYRTLGDQGLQWIHVYSTPQELRDTFSALEAMGVDEIMLSPGVPDLEQIDRLADVAG
jgi:alkanesulfonate monooxygenase SsuD/methylene tetrahydromethanopterin reductase-like flavin-dependent oxidoreductase (luciferase family)